MLHSRLRYGATVVILFFTIVHCQNNYNQQSPATYQTPGYGPSPKPCGIPNLVLGTPFNPQSIRGIWYNYRVQTRYCLTKPTYTANVVYRFQTVGSPSSANYDLGELQTIEVFYYDGPNDYQCHRETWFGSVSTRGNLDGHYEGVPLSTILLFIDENLYIAYHCLRPNLATGICDAPAIEINTRIRPDYLTQQQRYALDKSIDYCLGRYGIYAADIPLHTWIGYKPLCSDAYSFTQSECAAEFMANAKIQAKCPATYY